MSELTNGFENINAGAPEVIIEDLWDLLQYHVTTFFDNEVAQLPPARHRGGQPLKTLSERIKSKEGRIRHNLAGKRTDFSARTVISPDPLIGLNEVGVPLSIAMQLTIPERVSDWNKEYLKKLVENGPKKYPGANYVIKPNGRRKTITDETKEEILEELEDGFIVERHLIDGDVSLFNKPLHRMSMMCHLVKVLPGNTFRLNQPYVTLTTLISTETMNFILLKTSKLNFDAGTDANYQSALRIKCSWMYSRCNYWKYLLTKN